jgi:hypothetical protein
MFRRTFWFTAGAAAGVWATTKVNQKLRQLAPESLAAQAAGRALEAGHRLKDFALDVRTGMVRREAELDEALGLEPRRGPAIPAAPRRQLPPAADRVPQPRTRRHDGAHPFTPHNGNEDH